MRTKSVSFGAHDRCCSLSCTHDLLWSPSWVLLEVVPIQTPRGFFCPLRVSFCCPIWVFSLTFSGLICRWCGSFCCSVELLGGSWIYGGVFFCSFCWSGGFVLGWTEGLVDVISNGFLGSWPSTVVIGVRFGFILLYMTCNSGIMAFKHYSECPPSGITWYFHHG